MQKVSVCQGGMGRRSLKCLPTFIGLTLFIFALQVVVGLPYLERMQMSVASGLNVAMMYLKFVVRALFVAMFLALPLLYIGRRWLRVVYLGFCSVLTSLLYFVESYLFYANGAVYSYGVLQAMAGTNAEETREYWASFDWSRLFVPILLFVGIVVLTYLLTYLLTLVSKIRFALVGQGCKRWGRLALTLFVCLSLAFLQLNAVVWVERYAQINAMASTSLERLLWNTYGFVQDAERQREGAEKIASLDLGEVSRHQLPPHNLVIIIGESLSRDYMHLYGYPLENTPWQDSLFRTGDLVTFTDAVSPTPGTVGSVTRMMTFLRNETRQSNWYDYPALTEVLERAGYRTVWTTNQETMGQYVQPIGTLLSLADEPIPVNAHSAMEGYRNLYPDEDVLPYLRQARAEESLCQIVHLLGSHQDYKLRYPRAYSRYKGADLAFQSKGVEKDSVVAHYLNTVYYNDYVVGEIVRRYADTPAIVLYLSDHGQTLYDNPEQPEVCTHALLPESVRVPLWFYVSPSLQAQAPTLKPLIEAKRTKPIMLDILPNSLCGLLGIKHSLDEERFDIFSPKYDQERPRIVLGFEGGAFLQM